MSLWLALAGSTRRTVMTVAAFTFTRATVNPVRAAGGASFAGTSTPLFQQKTWGQTRASSSTTSIQSATLSADLESKLGVTHPAYEVIEKDVVTEYGAYCTRYRHVKSGAELLSVSSDDDNKVFGITFRTPPSDSTGVPHILEHSVLCGSRKYTTKDPFVQLLQGSLQTFLNAFTYPDRTCYVVASQNKKDFYNLVNVYADAVFFPRAIEDPMVHAQEGWHLELEDKNDPLVYKGVVYNEMKGVYSSPDSLLMRTSQQSIFPDNTYGVDSGGDPKVIPNLSFEQFADFHAEFYHPSNSRIYFSGDDDVYERLELMDDYLKEFDDLATAEKSKIQWQPKSFSESKKITEHFPVGADQPALHMMTVNWLLNDKPMTSLQQLTLAILDHLLLGTTSSVLRKTLMESGLGEAITGGGLSDELLQATFSVGMKGIEADKVNDVESLVLATLKKVAEEGFSEEEMAASMNTIEFSLREFNTGSFPKGLSFMLGSMSNWIYDKSPTEALKFEEPLAQLKSSIAGSGSKIFQDLLREWLVENNHRTTVELAPSKTLEEETLKEEKDRLAEIQAGLSDEELEQIIFTTKTLKELQKAEDTPEDRATIPSLELSDLKRENTEYPTEVTENENNSGITVLRHELGSTSGIAYVNFGVDLSPLSLDDAPLLPLFVKMMKETGAGPYDFVELSQQIGTYTGGISLNVMSSSVYPEGADESKVMEGDHLVTKLFIQGKATTDRTDKLFSFFRVMLTEAKFETSQARVIEILKESKARLQTQIQSSGHSMVNTRMLARYRVKGYLNEIMSGITYLETLQNLLKQAEEDWPSLLARLENMRTLLLQEDTTRSGMLVDITGDAAVMEAIKPNLHEFLDSLPGKADSKTCLIDPRKDIHPWVPEAKKRMAENFPVKDQGFVVPTQVSYVGKAGKIFSEGEEVQGSADVVSRFLRTGYLWDRVRVMGGAYGGFCQFVTSAGFFSFLSYRDPNLHQTLDVYDQAADALEEAAEALENDPEALATAIIGAIGDEDSCLSPDQKGYTAMTQWLINESAEHRQKMRDEILNTKPSDFRDFAQRLRNMKDPAAAVVSSKAAFEAASEAGMEFELKEVF